MDHPNRLPPKKAAPGRHHPTERGLAIATGHHAPTTPRTKISTWKCLSPTGERTTRKRPADRLVARPMRHKGRQPPHAPAMDHHRENRCPRKAATTITPPARSRIRHRRLRALPRPPSRRPRPFPLRSPAESGKRPRRRRLLPWQTMCNGHRQLGRQPPCRSDPPWFRATELAILKRIC